MRLIKTKKNFRKEFRRQLRYAIAAGCGFLIIFAWREAILDFTKYILDKIMKSSEIIATDVGAAITITAIAVLIILISSKLLKD